MALNNEAEGGYDFEVVGGVAKELQCPICHLLLRNAMELPCHHTSCKICITKWEEQTNEWNEQAPFLCTLCKSIYQSDQVRKNIVLDRLITSSLDVKCQQHEDGCKWIDKIENYQVHKRECLYAIFGCQFGECQEKMKRKDLQLHSLKCPYRSVKCIHCNQENGYNILEQHYNICPAFIIPCKNAGCTTTMMRKELNAHMDVECDFQMINCEYHHAGCDVMVPKNQMDSHVEEFNKTHMSMLLKMTMQRNDRLMKAEQEIKEVKEQVKELKEDLEKKTQQINDLKKPFNSNQNSRIPIPSTRPKVGKAMAVIECTETFDSLLQTLQTNQPPNNNYSRNLQQLCNFMITDTFYPGNSDKELYIKIDIKKKWIRGRLYGYLVTEDKLRDESKCLCKYKSNNVCIVVYHKLLEIFLHKEGWTVENANGWLLHPQRNKLVNDDYSIDDYSIKVKEFKQRLLCDGHIVIKMEKKN